MLKYDLFLKSKQKVEYLVTWQYLYNNVIVGKSLNLSGITSDFTK